MPFSEQNNSQGQSLRDATTALCHAWHYLVPHLQSSYLLYGRALTGDCKPLLKPRSVKLCLKTQHLILTTQYISLC